MSVYLRYFTDNLAKNIFMVLLSAIICALSLFCLNHQFSIYHCLEVYKAYGLDEGIVYLMDEYFPSQEQKDEVIGEIKNLDSVNEARFLDSTSSVAAIIDDYQIYMINITQDVAYFPWKIEKGRMIERDSSNEICLSSNFIGIYDVGDIIDVEIYDHEAHKGKLSIVGFFDIDSYMPNDLGTFRYEVEAWEGNRTAYAFTCNLIDNDGKKIEFDSSNIISVKPREGYDVEKTKEQIVSILNGGVARTYADYKEIVYNRNKDTNDLINLFCVASFILLIAVLSAFTLIQISVNKNILLVYYINGCTWSKAVSVACFSNLPLLIIGMGLGVLLYIKVPMFSVMTNGDFLFDERALIIVLLIMMVVYFLLCGLFYLFTVRESATEQIRGE